MNTNIFSKELKEIYNSAIDQILSKEGLTVPCILRYVGGATITYCNNCIFDPISGLSANQYNGVGPSFFPDGGICPVCAGAGTGKNYEESSETVNLAVIFDSKYWINWSSKSMNIPDGMVQVICSTSLLPKLRNASEMVIDTTLLPYGNYVYERAGDPTPVGFGQHNYIFSMWKRK